MNHFYEWIVMPYKITSYLCQNISDDNLSSVVTQNLYSKSPLIYIKKILLNALNVSFLIVLLYEIYFVSYHIYYYDLNDSIIINLHPS